MRIELSGNTPGDVAWHKACWAPSAGILKSTLLCGGCVRGQCVSVPGGGMGVGKGPNRTKSEPCFTRGSGFPRGQASAAGEGGPRTHCMASDVTAGTCLPSPPLLTSSRWMVFPLPAVCLGPHPLASMAVLLGSLRLASSRLLFAHRETCSTKQGVSGVPVCT